jgi:hypothetical protein
VEKYLSEPALRSTIALAGLRRVVEGGHDVVSRMRDVLSSVGVHTS